MFNVNVILFKNNSIEENYLFSGENSEDVAKKAESKMIEILRSEMSNFDEYTSEDIDNILEDGYESFGNGAVFITWPDIVDVDKEIDSENNFVFRGTIEYSIPHIDSEVVRLCAALNEPIEVGLQWESHYRNGNGYAVRVNADIYSVDEELAAEEFSDYWDSGCDDEIRYSGDYNWSLLGKDYKEAISILQKYVDEQKRRYPGYDIRISK